MEEKRVAGSVAGSLPLQEGGCKRMVQCPTGFSSDRKLNATPTDPDLFLSIQITEK
jgi:hypothetical protein